MLDLFGHSTLLHCTPEHNRLELGHIGVDRNLILTFLKFLPHFIKSLHESELQRMTSGAVIRRRTETAQRT